MRKREKHITALCRTPTGIEWTTVKVTPDEVEPVCHDSLLVDLSDETPEHLFESIHLPDSISEKIKGDISVPIRTADLLMRVISLPTTDPDEIVSMLDLQVDKISPFPADQMAYSYEILKTQSENTLLLLAMAQRTKIDQLGDIFKEKGVFIHSIDSRDMGWLQLLNDAKKIDSDSCEIILIDDGIGFSLIIINKGIPLAFRTLHTETDGMTDALDEIVYEITYTLSTLAAEYDLEPATSIQYWTYNPIPTPMRAHLAEKSGLKINAHDLSILPPLSEGILRRTLKEQQRIELIPAEWSQLEQRKQIRKKAIQIGGKILALWLISLILFFAFYKVREHQLKQIRTESLKFSPLAAKALQDSEKLHTLTVYTDRSDSALECLREVVRMLPPGDIKLASFGYNKTKGVSIRGTANNDRLVDDYLIKLTKSKLFDRIKNQSSSRRQNKTLFSASLTIAPREDRK
jgi:hypothetical protein